MGQSYEHPVSDLLHEKVAASIKNSGYAMIMPTPKIRVDEIPRASQIEPGTSAGTLPFLAICHSPVGTTIEYFYLFKHKSSEFEQKLDKIQRIIISE